MELENVHYQCPSLKLLNALSPQGDFNIFSCSSLILYKHIYFSHMMLSQVDNIQELDDFYKLQLDIMYSGLKTGPGSKSFFCQNLTPPKT